jgi:hypothetical protein
MIFILVPGKSYQSFEGLSFFRREACSQVFVALNNSLIGVNDEAIAALSSAFVHAEVDLGDENPLNFQVKLAERSPGNFELLLRPLQEAQGGWASH